jgi:hypothetical protein
MVGVGRVRKPAWCRGNAMARRLSPTDEAFSWLFDGNEIVRWGLAYSYQSRNEAPRCKRGRSCLHLSAFRPKLDEFRSQRSSAIAAKSWRGPQRANDPMSRPVKTIAERRPSDPVELQTCGGTVGTAPEGPIQAGRDHSSASASRWRCSGVARAHDAALDRPARCRRSLDA